WQGLTPIRSIRHGTSTHASAGRLSIRPAFSTLPPILYGTPVRMASMMYEAYSSEREWLTWPSCRIEAFSSFQPLIWLTQRRGYSSSGMLYASISSGYLDLMNSGLYSALCSLDSVQY